ncbi:GH36 C-terminal domain-containing protein [Enterococcus alcedinis]|uniref:GH36 C-terminal domain-containing protein n=1 Tax=Enterococcus alcedinis TaxID=1274384 RepID=UPI003616F0E3
MFYFQILSQASQPLKKVKFQGLDPDSLYEIRGQILSGDELMAYGLYLNHEFYGDFQSKRIPFKKINQ